MKLSRCLTALIALTSLTISNAALANYTCSGLVHGVAIEGGGDVLVENIGSIIWARFCNIHASSNSITPEACKAMYASLLIAQSSGKSITFWVNDPTTSCGALPQWQFVNGLFLLRIDG